MSRVGVVVAGALTVAAVATSIIISALRRGEIEMTPIWGYPVMIYSRRNTPGIFWMLIGIAAFAGVGFLAVPLLFVLFGNSN